MEENQMQVTLDAFEQAIEDSAEQFVPITGAKRQEIEALLGAAKPLVSPRRVPVPLVSDPYTQRLRA
jgi:hypothetical protein